MEPKFYTYEASEHCVACANERFGRADRDFVGGLDNEGNEIGAGFDYFEDRDMTCGTCGEEINTLSDEEYDDDGPGTINYRP